MAALKAGPSRKASAVSTLTLMFGDCVVTTLWVLCSSLFGEVATYLAQISGQSETLVGLSVLVLALAAFAPLCNFFNGAMFNPLNPIALIASSHGSVSVSAMRMVGQLAGAMLGTLAALRVIPVEYQGKFHMNSGGVRDGVAFELGFACEGTLSLILNYIFLLSVDSSSRLLKVWVPLLSAILLTAIGFHFTGPSLNPFVSFAWDWHYQRHSTAEHLLVFWTAPILGALAAGLLYMLLNAPPKKRGRSRAAAKKRL